MKIPIPLISYEAAASQAVPFASLAKFGISFPAARRWVLAWAASVLVSDGAGLWFALHGTRNLWIGYFTDPLVFGGALTALSYWQANPTLRKLFRVAIPILVLVWIVLVAGFENTGTFSLVTGPLKALILFTASLGTLLSCSWRLEGSLIRQDWFWVCLGLALRYGASAGLDPIARILVGEDIPTLITVHVVGAWIDTIASLLIAGGLLCPIPPLRPFSGRSSPASLPSPSY